MKTLHCQIQSLPAYTPAGAHLFFAGNFNNWNPRDPAYRFLPEKDGSLSLSFTTTLETIEGKITRGQWTEAEGDADCQPLSNRVIKTGSDDQEIWFRVASWTDMQEAATCHTASEQVVLLHPDFYIPQLDRHRKIWAYLPPDYWSGARRYPVVYMQDGQNLFDACGTIGGEWGVDKALNRLFSSKGAAGMEEDMSCIIVAIENGGENRIDEYAPWTNPEHGGGEGDRYLAFICDTLKPYIDRHLRALPDRQYTGIMGSSMGGLISLYGATERPDIFGMAGVFSPSLWFSKTVFQHVLAQKAKFPVKILLMAGQQESKTMVNDLLDLYETLLEAGHEDANLHYDLHSDGTHTEHFWAREFEHAFRWLFGDMPGHRHGSISNQFIHFRNDEKFKQLIVRVDPRLRSPKLEIRDYCHDREFHYPLYHADNRIPYAQWEQCLYAIRLLSDGDLVFSRRVHLNEVEPQLTPSI
jgi:metallo-beta-lactamase class B